MLVGVTAPDLLAEDPVAEARKILYTKRAQAITILEDVVAQSPDRVDAWVALIQALSVDGLAFTADLQSRASLALHPKSGELLQARMALLKGSQDLELLTQLEALPGYCSQTHDIREIVHLGLHVPFTWDDVNIYGWWGHRLIDAGQWERATQIVARGNQRTPRNPMLPSCQVMLLAQAGKYAEALAVESRSPIGLTTKPGWGLANLLLQRGEAALVVKLYGAKIPDRHDEEDARLILLQSLLVVGNTKGAKNVELQCVGDAAKLLRLADLRRRKQDAAVEELAHRLILDWAEAYAAPSDPFARVPALPRRPRLWPPSLGSIMSETVARLEEAYPNRHDAIHAHVGVPADYLKKAPQPLPLTATEKVLEMQRQLSYASEAEAEQLHRRISIAWEAAGRYDEAMAEDAAWAVQQRALSNTKSPDIPLVEVHWSRMRQRAEAVRFFTKHPDKITSARRSIHQLTRPAHQRIATDGSSPAAIRSLIEIGPSGIAFPQDAVLRDSHDKSDLFAVVEQLGRVQDVPWLIECQRSYVRSLRDMAHNEDSSHQLINYLRSEGAVNMALTRITGTKPHGESPEQRYEYWRGWWDAHAMRTLQVDN